MLSSTIFPRIFPEINPQFFFLIEILLKLTEKSMFIGLIRNNFDHLENILNILNYYESDLFGRTRLILTNFQPDIIIDFFLQIRILKIYNSCHVFCHFYILDQSQIKTIIIILVFNHSAVRRLFSKN